MTAGPLSVHVETFCAMVASLPHGTIWETDFGRFAMLGWKQKTERSLADMLVAQLVYHRVLFLEMSI